MTELQNNISQAQNEEAYGGAIDNQRSVIAQKLTSSRMSNMARSRSGAVEDRDEVSSYNY
jgi:hypothetical protein